MLSRPSQSNLRHYAWALDPTLGAYLLCWLPGRAAYGSERWPRAHRKLNFLVQEIRRTPLQAETETRQGSWLFSGRHDLACISLWTGSRRCDCK